MSAHRLTVFLFLAGLCYPVADLGAQWKLSTQPSLNIGAVDGNGAAAFGRVVGAISLPSATVVVADGLASEIRYFKADGTPLITVGRPGDGPGEFRAIKSLHRCARDSVFVYDPAALRITVLSSMGKVARTIDVRTRSENGMAPYDITCNQSGTFAYINRSPAPPGGPGPRRPLVVIALSSGVSPPVTLGTFPASERYFNGQNDFPRPLGKITSVALGKTVAYVGLGDAPLVSSFGFSGQKLGTLSVPGERVGTTPDQIEQYVSEQIADRSNGNDSAAVRRFYRSVVYPDAYPYYGRMLADTLDNLWVEQFPRPGLTTRHWSVLTRAGRSISTIAIPPAFELLEVGDHHVLGVWRDENGVEFVRRYSVLK